MGSRRKGALERRLALAELANQALVQKRFRGGRLRSAAFAFCDLAELVGEERALENRKGPSIIPFHLVMSEVSPLYRQVFARAERVGLRLKPTLASYNRLIEEYEPFGRDLPVPVFKDEIHWLCARPVSEAAVGTLSAISAFNFSVFHEALHKIFYLVVPPPKMASVDGWRNYFLLIESLVGVHETLLADEMGPRIARPLKSINSVYRALPAGEAGRVGRPAFKPFAANLLTHLGTIHGRTGPHLRKMLPAWAPYDARSTVGYGDQFANQVVPEWLANRAPRRAGAHAKIGGSLRLREAELDLLHLVADRETVGRLYALCRTLFYGKLIP